MTLTNACFGQSLEYSNSVIEHRNKPVLAHQYEMREGKHSDDPGFERVFGQEHRTRLSDSQFRARKASRSIGNAGRAASLAYSEAFAAQQRKYCSPMWMLAKVWRHHDFTSNQCGVSGNDFRGLCQTRYLVRLTTSRGELPLKVCEKISVG